MTMLILVKTKEIQFQKWLCAFFFLSEGSSLLLSLENLRGFVVHLCPFYYVMLTVNVTENNHRYRPLYY